MTARLARVSIRDFQSLADVDLPLGQVTVIVGPTNSGKSAFVRAMQAALFNQSGGDFVRSGCSKAGVAFVFDTGLLKWVKPRKGGAEYTAWQGDDYQIAQFHDQIKVTRAGKDAVPIIEGLTGVREIETDGVRARLQFDGQFDEPFLLSSSGGQAAKLLSHVSKLDVLVKAQVHAKQDLGRAKKRSDDAEARANELSVKLEAMPDYEALLETTRQLQARLAEQADLYVKATKAATWQEELGKASALADSWEGKNLRNRLFAESRMAERIVTTVGLVDQGRTHNRMWKELQGQRDKAKTMVERAEGELEGLLAELKICPVCRRPM